MMYTTQTWNETYIWKVNPFGEDYLIAKKWDKDGDIESYTMVMDKWGNFTTQ